MPMKSGPTLNSMGKIACNVALVERGAILPSLRPRSHAAWHASCGPGRQALRFQMELLGVHLDRRRPMPSTKLLIDDVSMKFATPAGVFHALDHVGLSVP